MLLPGGREEEGEEEVCLDTTREEEAVQGNRRLREEWEEARNAPQCGGTSPSS